MEPLLDIGRAAKALSISPWTVRSYIRSGRLRAVRLGRRVLLEAQELRRLVAEAKANGESGNHQKQEVQ